LWQRVSRLRASAGFTMPELIVIIVVVGVLAATVAVKFGPLAYRTNLRMAIDQVAGDLRFLQCRAMASLYTTGTVSNTVSFLAGYTAYTVCGQKKWLPDGVMINTNTGLTVTFNSLGEYPSATDAILTLNSGGLAYTIKIFAISGDVEAY
jgi:Tfp pilus assembly protein FimT